MKNRIYLIKNISPWMINELLAFSQFVTFHLILLRKPPAIFKEDLAVLTKRGITIYIRPFRSFPSIKKILFASWFIVKNLFRFWSLKNFVFGIKAIYWFIMLKDNIIPENSYIHAQFATQASIIALLYKHYLQHVEYSFTFHAHDIYFNNSWLSKLVKESEVTFTISNYAVEYLSKQFQSIKTHKLIISKLGTFIPDKLSIFKLKEKCSLVLGFLGMFVEEKNIFILLEATRKLVESAVSIKLKLAGFGPLEDAVLNFIKNKNLSDSVTYLGLIYGEEKDQFFKNIDVLVLPSKSEGLPVVLMEAVSYGVPIISTNISGIPEICKNNYNGFLIPPNDVNALMEAILKFYHMDNVQFQQFKHRAYESSRDYDIILNSKNKLEKLGWIESQE